MTGRWLYGTSNSWSMERKVRSVWRLVSIAYLFPSCNEQLIMAMLVNIEQGIQCLQRTSKNTPS